MFLRRTSQLLAVLLVSACAREHFDAGVHEVKGTRCPAREKYLYTAGVVEDATVTWCADTTGRQ